MRNQGSEYRIVDEGALHKYRTEIPNTVIRGIKGRGLSLPARWLYVYLKSVAGDSSECFQSTTTIAEGAQMSRGAVANAKAELIDRKLIAVAPGHRGNHVTDKIRIIDLWDANMSEFSSIARSSDEHGTEHKTPESTQASAKRVHEVNPAVHEVNPAVHEVNPAVHEVNAPLIGIKKIPVKKIPSEEEEKDSLTSFESHASAPSTDHQASEEPKPPRPKKSASLDTAYTPGFLAWWQAYPADRRSGKPACFRIWKEQRLEARTAELVAKLERLVLTAWSTEDPKERRYIKTALPYLNGGCFEDDLHPLPTAVSQEQSGLSKAGYDTMRAAQRLVERRFGHGGHPEQLRGLSVGPRTDG